MDLGILDNLNIGSVALAPLVVGLVALAKSLGLRSQYWPWLTGVLSALAFGLHSYLDAFPVYLAVAEPLAQMVLIFLVSSGFYQLGKVKAETVKNNKITTV